MARPKEPSSTTYLTRHQSLHGLHDTTMIVDLAQLDAVQVWGLAFAVEKHNATLAVGVERETMQSFVDKKILEVCNLGYAMLTQERLEKQVIPMLQQMPAEVQEQTISQFNLPPIITDPNLLAEASQVLQP